jgi:ActR/RegA family two-component response regulator
MIDSADLWKRFCAALAQRLESTGREDLWKAWSTHPERTSFYRRLLKNIAEDLGLDFQHELFTVDFVMWTRSDPPIPVVFVESENYAFTAHHEVRKLSCIAAPLRILIVPIEWDDSPGVWPKGGWRRQLLDQWRQIVVSYQRAWSRSGVFALVIGEWRPDNILRFYANAFDARGDLVSNADQVLVEMSMKERPAEFRRTIDDDLPKIVLAAVEDPALRNQPANVCEKYHYTFIHAASSAEVTKLMQQIVPNVVVVSLAQGKADVIQWQRNRHLAATLLVLSHTEEEAVDAIKAGASDYLILPLNDDQLQSSIERALLENRTKAYDFAAFDKKSR